MKPGGLVEFLENALRPHLPAPAASPPRCAVDWRSLAERFAASRLRERGFVDASALYDAFSDGLMVRLRHECGAWCVFTVGHREFVTRPDPEAARVLGDIIRDRAGCYCVRPYVDVPCTAQRCAP